VARRQAVSHNEAVRKRQRKRARRPAADSLVFSFLSAAEAVEARLEAAVSPTGLSLAKLAVLHFLADAKEPLPLSDLAARQHCVRSNITQLMDRLEKDGLVRRRADPADRRSVLAELTPAGEQAHAKGVRALAEAQRAIVSALSAGDAAKLKNVLGALTS
jgi:DNA-binding MarR family transcriptional regulator